MVFTIKLAINYIIHWFRAYSPKGYGIHSPLVFDFTQKVLCRESMDESLSRIDALRRRIISSEGHLVPVGCEEADCKDTRYTTASELACYSSATPRLGRLLYGIARWSGAQNILELGTSVGLGALYLGLASSSARVITLEGDPHRASLARRNFAEMGASSIELLQGSFSDTLSQALASLGKLDLLYMDGNHRGDATLMHFEACYHHLHPRSVVVIDDIRWSDDMHWAWQQLRNDPRVSASIDLFRVGILLFRERMPKQHFEIKCWLY